MRSVGIPNTTEVILKQKDNDDYRCLHHLYSRERLSDHASDCERMNDCAIVLPSDSDKWLYVRNYNRKERLPFVVYADLEYVLEKEEKTEFASPNRFAYQRHRAFNVGYYVRSASNEAASTYRSHRGENCIAWFADELNALAREGRFARSRP